MRKCIDSILAQTFTDFECLLIDDGSTDGSPAICDEYALKDERIKVFHKQNGGLSDARNYGLALAKGKYTIFADPDDWVDTEGLDKLYEKAIETKADIVICDIYYNDPYRQKYCKQEPTSLNHYDVLNDLLKGKRRHQRRRDLHVLSEGCFTSCNFGLLSSRGRCAEQP